MKDNTIIVEERQVVSALEAAAKNKISVVIARKAELKDKKEELEGMLLANRAYAEAVQQAKTAAKVKKDAKTRAMETSGLKALELATEIKELQSETKETQLSLFDYLLDLSRKGLETITDNTGESHVINVTASIDI